jgi:hypothetical protein
MFFLSICTGTILQAQQDKKIKTFDNQGTAVINQIVLPDGKIVVDNAFKQHTLFKKAKQWIDKNYTARVTTDQDVIYVENDEYKLVLVFQDGMFTYHFRNNIKGLEMKQQQIIDTLVQYVRTCKLEDTSW